MNLFNSHNIVGILCWDDGNEYRCDKCGRFASMTYEIVYYHYIWRCNNCKDNEPDCWIPIRSTPWDHKYIINMKYAIELSSNPDYSYIKEYITRQKL